MNHLEEAKRQAQLSQGADGVEWAQYKAQLATVHVLIALVEMLSSNFEENVEEAVQRRVSQD